MSKRSVFLMGWIASPYTHFKIALHKTATIHQVTIMLATYKNVLFLGPDQLLTTGADDPSLQLSPSLVLGQ